MRARSTTRASSASPLLWGTVPQRAAGVPPVDTGECPVALQGEDLFTSTGGGRDSSLRW